MMVEYMLFQHGLLVTQRLIVLAVPILGFAIRRRLERKNMMSTIFDQAD